jgi:HK97 family phage major capsid protein
MENEILVKELKDTIAILVDKQADISKERIDELTTTVQNLTEKVNTEIMNNDGSFKGVKYVANEKQRFADAVEKGVAAYNKGSNESKQMFSVDFEISEKAAMTTGSNLDNTNGPVIQPSVNPELMYEPFRPEHLRDILRVISTDSDKHQHTRRFNYLPATATVAEGVSPLESKFSFKQYETKIKEIAGSLTVTNQMLDDVKGLQYFIANQVIEEYYNVEDREIMYGSGTGLSLDGIRTSATAFANGTRKAKFPNPNDVLRILMYQLRKNNYQASAFILPASIACDLDVLKNEFGDYINGQAILKGTRIWETTLIGENEFMGLDGSRGVTIVDRTGLNMAMSNQHLDNFTKRQVTFLASKRLGVAHYFNECVIKGDMYENTVASPGNPIVLAANAAIKMITP